MFHVEHSALPEVPSDPFGALILQIDVMFHVEHFVVMFHVEHICGKKKKRHGNFLWLQQNVLMRCLHQNKSLHSPMDPHYSAPISRFSKI
jgi:hypothetical protein